MRKVYLSNNISEKDKFWESNWSGRNLERLIEETGFNFMNPIFLRFFPKKGRILEAGCGLGKFVIYYRRLGYDIEGVDFAKKSIDRIKEYDPSLPVRVEDLNSLSCKDGYYDIYFSGGVAEHFEDGPQELLAEARRVLSDGGLLIITVPYMNLSRRIEDFIYFRILGRKVKCNKGIEKPYDYFPVKGCFKGVYSRKGCLFHEYVFSRKEIIGILKRGGFSPMFFKPVQIGWGIKTLGLSGKSTGNANKGSLRSYFKRLFLDENKDTLPARLLNRILGVSFAHQIAIVCQKDQFND